METIPVSELPEKLMLRQKNAITDAQQFKYDMMLYEAAIQLMKAKLQVLQ